MYLELSILSAAQYAIPFSAEILPDDIFNEILYLHLPFTSFMLIRGTNKRIKLLCNQMIYKKINNHFEFARPERWEIENYKYNNKGKSVATLYTYTCVWNDRGYHIDPTAQKFMNKTFGDWFKKQMDDTFMLDVKRLECERHKRDLVEGEELSQFLI